MDRVVLYIHGQGGNPEEAKHYNSLFKDYDVIGLDYTSETPWEAKIEFPKLFDSVCDQYKCVILIANSIGAYFAMNALYQKKIDMAYFISPIVDMQRLIENMMILENITENELHENGMIKNTFGQTISWNYLSYVKNNKIIWDVPTHILYGEKDKLTSLSTISEFAKQIGATFTIMENGEHWFHTEEQMKFRDNWIMFREMIKNDCKN